MGVSQAYLSKFTQNTDAAVPNRIVFGIAGLDQDGVDKYDPEAYYGEVVWQDDFDISPVSHQSYLKLICDTLKNETGLVLSADTVVCPMADFESFLNSTSDVFPYQVSDDADTQKLAFSSQWQLFLESEFAADSLAEALSYVDEDGEIKLYAIKFDTTLTSAVFDVDDFSDYRAKVDDFIADASEACPDTLCDSTFQTEFLWLLVTIVNAFSVDYVVHLANAYLESAAQSREDRLSIALLTIGISVVSGAITTGLCSIVLLFVETLFFKIMGVILLTTVLSSIAWAMLFFTALCAAFGPEGDAGDLKKYWRRWAPAKCGGQSDDT